MPRSYGPLYIPTGDERKDRLAFVHLLEKLKTQKRTGWVDHKERFLEQKDHMYRMAVLALSSDATDIDIAKCVMMCLVHDLAEAQAVVGDIAPREGIPKEVKQHLEAEAMKNIVQDMLHDSIGAQKMEALWKEYEEGVTAEARFVKGAVNVFCPALADLGIDLDRFEMATQAFEYERDTGVTTLQPFFDSSVPNISHPEVKNWGDDLLRERKEMHEQRIESNEPKS